MRSRCVVALTVVAVFTFCKAANGAARVSGAEEPQAYGLPITTPLVSRRQWPTRLLKSVAASGFSSYFERIPGGKWLSKKMGFRHKFAEEESATNLFHATNLEDVNARGFFKSREFEKWENKVKLKHKGDADGQMFLTLNKQFTAEKNGGVEPIIALALNDKTTRDVGLRFENELLRTLAAGMKEGDEVAMNRYVRYGLYRNPKHGSLDDKMQRYLGGTPPAQLIKSYKKSATHSGEVSTFEYLENYFAMSSGGERVKDIYLDLLPTKGFDNNNFLFQRLYEEAARKGLKKDDFANFMLTTLRKENGFTNVENANYLLRLKESKISKDLRKKVVNPLFRKVVASLPKEMRNRYKMKSLILWFKKFLRQ